MLEYHVTQVTWLREGVELENSKRHQIRVKDGKTTLTVIDVQDEDEGYYTVKVANELGNDTSRASLTISSELKCMH